MADPTWHREGDTHVLRRHPQGRTFARIFYSPGWREWVWSAASDCGRAADLGIAKSRAVEVARSFFCVPVEDLRR